jgi:olefin beta-lactone synthetase
LNLIEPFLNSVGRWADRPAVIDPAGGVATFASLEERSRQLAAAWRRAGLRPGDRVLLAMPLGVNLYASIAALWRLGAVVVFSEPSMGVRGLRYAARVISPRAYLSSGWLQALAVLPEIWRIPLKLTSDVGSVGADDVHNAANDFPALISFTSGSTGAPKAMIRTHGLLAAQNACVADLLRPQCERQIDLVAFPVFVIANLGQGVTSVLPSWKVTRHDRATAAQLARLIAAHKVVRALIPPSICETLARGEAIHGLRTILTGGGPVFPDLLQRLAARLSTGDILAVYGSTEAEPIAHQRYDEIDVDDWERMRQGGGLLAGRPVKQIRLDLIDDEIVVTGDHVNKGYLDPAADAETKLRRDDRIWHRTGDAGRLDQQGRLWLLGRKEAKAGSCYPFTVEAAARLWPGVRQVALVPGETPPVLAIAGDASRQAEWRAKAENLAGLRVLVLDSIPLDRRHRSKIDYNALRKAAREEVRA